MTVLTATPDEAAVPDASAASGTRASFEALYDEHVDRIYRSLRRFGVAESSLDDAVQEVFVTAYRRLDAFEGRSSLSTWLCGIALHVARSHRRHARRHPETPTEDPSVLDGPSEGSLERTIEDAEAVRILAGLLDELDDDKREAFVLSELEQLSAPEIAASLGINVNTAYARIRAARAAFEQAVSRHRARDRWRLG
ncbi:MAG: RNA polymerase sigma factor [Myxococcales bacterium]|jgi:RNA polymerase sigma-70 factor (ECF subfamily)|nr:RNA polymerase sigma factor [Myxococcales bacterium]